MTAHASRLPFGLTPLIGEAKQRMRRRRSLAALLVVLVGLAVGLLFVLRLPPGGSGVAPPLASVVRAGELEVSVPHGLNSYEIRGGHMAGTRAPVVGYVLTNFRPPAHLSIQRVLGRWAMEGPAANRVALEFERWFHPGPVGPQALDGLHLPLSLDQRWFSEKLGSGMVGYRWGYLTIHGAEYEVMYWSGPKAPAADGAAILRALKSIRPAR